MFNLKPPRHISTLHIGDLPSLAANCAPVGTPHKSARLRAGVHSCGSPTPSARTSDQPLLSGSYDVHRLARFTTTGESTSKPAWRHDGSAIVFHRIPPNTPAGSFFNISPALLEYGEAFPAFLAGFEPAQSLPYLPHVARLEWLRHAAFHAPDAEPMDGARLAEVPVDHLDRVVLHLHPSAGLLVSPYPVFSIWRTNSMDADVRAIGPEMSGEAALVLRPKLEVGSILLPPGGAAFISAIADGNGLARAAEQAAADAPDFALAETLGTCLARGLFTGFALKGGVL
jgi:hypothetical protein